MQIRAIIIVFLVLMGCKKPFPTTPETLLALLLEMGKKQESIVFIAGFDQGDNTYYANAKSYFKEKGMPVVDTLFSLEEIIDWLNQKAEHRTYFGEIHIVSHSNPWLGMSLRTTKNGQRITAKTLQDARRSGQLASAARALSDETKIIFHSCGLGENRKLMLELKHTFSNSGDNENSSGYENGFNQEYPEYLLGKSSSNNTPYKISAKVLSPNFETNFNTELRNHPSKETASTSKKGSSQNRYTQGSLPRVYASTFFNVFGGKFAGHYLAKPYYGFYPTGESKGPLYLSKEFKRAYPETGIDWFSALKTRTETQAGTPYSYKFNIPVNWKFTFDDVRDIPALQNREALLDFISESPEMAETLLDLNIPLEKYRWRSDIRGNTLRIKGKTTVLCVLAPILQDAYGTEYQNPNVTDPSLYQIL